MFPLLPFSVSSIDDCMKRMSYVKTKANDKYGMLQMAHVNKNNKRLYTSCYCNFLIAKYLYRSSNKSSYKYLTNGSFQNYQILYNRISIDIICHFSNSIIYD